MNKNYIEIKNDIIHVFIPFNCLRGLSKLKQANGNYTLQVLYKSDNKAYDFKLEETTINAILFDYKSWMENKYHDLL